MLKGRDTLLDKTGLPMPEKTFIRAMTGGLPGDGVMRQLPQDMLENIKFMTETERNKVNSNTKPGEKVFIDKLEYMETWQKWWANGKKGPEPKVIDFAKTVKTNQTDPRSKQYSGYQQSRDLNLTLGTFNVYFDKQGNALIKDTWKVDIKQDAPMGFQADIREGGNMSQAAFELARRARTYKPIPIEIKIPKEEWEKIRSVAPSGNYSSNESIEKYTKLIKVVTPWGKAVLDPVAGDLMTEGEAGVRFKNVRTGQSF
jgi:hypothetical protein